jgi:hypothetical protein
MLRLLTVLFWIPVMSMYLSGFQGFETLSPTTHPFPPVSDRAPCWQLRRYLLFTTLHWRHWIRVPCVSLWPFLAGDSTCIGWPAVPPPCVFPRCLGLSWGEDSLSRPREKTGRLALPSSHPRASGGLLEEVDTWGLVCYH